ncbi:MAG: glycosyltransferase family 39 protein [Planctomycetes bacterium]|nr:glycosyltransferase family 39 protein [Planctomycetota bacterium]
MLRRSSTSTWLLAALAVPLVVATAVRVAPLVEGGERLQRQCVTEDGYLMLTIARNLALGRGFSVSDGTIATNGTQPLCTLLYAACFRMVGGDKLRALYPIVGLQVLGAVLTAGAIYLVTRKCFYRGAHGAAVALAAAALWFASPASLVHTQNSLETGCYLLLALLTVGVYDAWADRLATSFSGGRCVVLGVWVGLSFLCRNDACFLAAALLAVHLLRSRRAGRTRRAIAQCAIIGIASLAVASPWLWFNVTHFGHLVPVSGRAEALGVTFAQNLPRAFVALLENTLPFLRVPGAWESETPTAAVSAIYVVAGLLLARHCRHWLGERFSPGVGILVLFAALLFSYYGLFFGVPGFFGRYLFVVVLLACLVGAAIVVPALAVENGPRRVATMTAVGLAAAACIAFDARIYRRGREHPHRHVVEWVAANVPETTWVGATQTGTLGYYHDRTINLDGKVNPIAFEYRKQRRVGEYVVAANVEYIVDWAGHAAWARLPEFAPNYELLLEDRTRNLAVLRRRAGPG